MAYMTSPYLGVLVEFKTAGEFYEKEKSGAKPNTQRIVGADDSRYSPLNNRTAKVIRIRRAENTAEHFMREITDISFWNGNFIISWKHSGD